jgi:hypothetical protein
MNANKVAHLLFGLLVMFGGLAFVVPFLLRGDPIHQRQAELSFTIVRHARRSVGAHSSYVLG